MMKKIMTKSLGCGFNCETFRLKSHCTFSPKFARSDAVHRRGNRGPMGTDARVRTLCVARKWVPRRARGKGRARPPLRQHPTPPRRRRRPRPHSRYHRHPREVRGRVPAANPSPSSRPYRDHEGSRIASGPSRRKMAGRRWRTTAGTYIYGCAARAPVCGATARAKKKERNAVNRTRTRVDFC